MFPTDLVARGYYKPVMMIILLVTSTLELLSRGFWWPEPWKLVKEFIRTCDICAHSKTVHHQPTFRIHNVSTAPNIEHSQKKFMFPSSKTTILLEFRDVNLLHCHMWNCRQGRNMRLTKTSTPAIVVENSNIWSYGEAIPFQKPHGNRSHIYEMLQMPFEIVITDTHISRPCVLGGGLRRRIMSQKLCQDGMWGVEPMTSWSQWATLPIEVYPFVHYYIRFNLFYCRLIIRTFKKLLENVSSCILQKFPSLHVSSCIFQNIPSLHAYLHILV